MLIKFTTAGAAIAAAFALTACASDGAYGGASTSVGFAGVSGAGAMTGVGAGGSTGAGSAVVDSSGGQTTSTPPATSAGGSQTPPGGE